MIEPNNFTDHALGRAGRRGSVAWGPGGSVARRSTDAGAAVRMVAPSPRFTSPGFYPHPTPSASCRCARHTGRTFPSAGPYLALAVPGGQVRRRGSERRGAQERRGGRQHGLAPPRAAHRPRPPPRATPCTQQPPPAGNAGPLATLPASNAGDATRGGKRRRAPPPRAFCLRPVTKTQK